MEHNPTSYRTHRRTPICCLPRKHFFLRFRDCAIYVGEMFTGVKTGRCEASVWGLSDSLLWPLGGSAGGPAFINTPQLSLAWINQNVFHASWVLLYPIIVNIVFSSIQLERNVDLFSISVLIVEIHVRVSLSRFGTLNETQSVGFIPRIHLLIGVCNIHMHPAITKVRLIYFVFSAALEMITFPQDINNEVPTPPVMTNR